MTSKYHQSKSGFSQISGILPVAKYLKSGKNLTILMSANPSAFVCGLSKVDILTHGSVYPLHASDGPPDWLHDMTHPGWPRPRSPSTMPPTNFPAALTLSSSKMVPEIRTDKEAGHEPPHPTSPASGLQWPCPHVVPSHSRPLPPHTTGAKPQRAVQPAGQPSVHGLSNGYCRNDS